MGGINKQSILAEVYEKYGEWLEMAGDDSPVLVIDILCNLLARERESSKYYARRIKDVQSTAANG